MALKNLVYLVENEMEAKILSSEGSSGIRGQLGVKYFPTDASGTGEINEDDLPEDPDDTNFLLGKPLTFRMEIDSAKDLPKDLCKNVFVTYLLNLDKKSTFRTQETEGKTQNPAFNFKQVHRIDCVTPSFLRYLTNGQVCFKVYGYPDFEMAREAAKKGMEESKKESVKKEQETLKSTMKVQQEMIKSGMKVTTVGSDGQIITGIATVPADKSGCCVIF